MTCAVVPGCRQTLPNTTPSFRSVRRSRSRSMIAAAFAQCESCLAWGSRTIVLVGADTSSIPTTASASHRRGRIAVIARPMSSATNGRLRLAYFGEYRCSPAAVAPTSSAVGRIVRGTATRTACIRSRSRAAGAGRRAARTASTTPTIIRTHPSTAYGQTAPNHAVATTWRTVAHPTPVIQPTCLACPAASTMNGDTTSAAPTAATPQRTNAARSTIGAATGPLRSESTASRRAARSATAVQRSTTPCATTARAR